MFRERGAVRRRPYPRSVAGWDSPKERSTSGSRTNEEIYARLVTGLQNRPVAGLPDAVVVVPNP